MDHRAAILGECFEELGILRHIDGGSFGQLPGLFHIGIKIIRGNVHTIPVAVVTQGHAHGQNADIVAGDQLAAQIASAVAGNNNLFFHFIYLINLLVNHFCKGSANFR